jgi:hypothetical protein
MVIGDLLRLAKDLYDMQAPLDAQVLLLDEATLAGGEPLVIVPAGEASGDLTHLVPDVQAGSVMFHIRRRTRIVALNGEMLS